MCHVRLLNLLSGGPTWSVVLEGHQNDLVLKQRLELLNVRYVGKLLNPEDVPNSVMNTLNKVEIYSPYGTE